MNVYAVKQMFARDKLEKLVSIITANSSEPRHVLIVYLNFSLCIRFKSTVKLGHNELGHKEHSVKNNKTFCPKLSFYYIYQPAYSEPQITSKMSRSRVIR